MTETNESANPASVPRRVTPANVAAATTSPAPRQTTSAPNQPGPRARRVIVAEDEAIIRLDLVEMLREEGYDVVAQAENGQIAVDKATELNPDLVIMDVKMPIRNGLDAATEIARNRIAPVVMLTAFSQREFVEKARDAGAMAYLVKPFTKADLIPAIEIAASRFGELTALEGEVADLSERLETRKFIERAKGILMESQGMTEPEAFRWIQRAAMDRRTTMKTIAHVVIDTLAAGENPGKSR